eukprot:scaffold73815_cov28-Tisochrysis_lutea.AAC.2
MRKSDRRASLVLWAPENVTQISRCLCTGPSPSLFSVAVSSLAVARVLTGMELCASWWPLHDDPALISLTTCCEIILAFRTDAPLNYRGVSVCVLDNGEGGLD